MKLRQAKKMAKNAIRKMKLKITRTNGRTFVVSSKPNFMCARFYVFIIVSEKHEKLFELEKEGKMKIHEWRNYIREKYTILPKEEV